MTTKETSTLEDDTKRTARSPTAARKSTLTRKKTITAKATTASSENKASIPATARSSPKKPSITNSRSSKPSIVAEERQRMISQAAFLISRRRDPGMGSPESDWIHAEVVIDMIFDTA